MSRTPARVLIVEDDPVVAMDLARLVEECGCTALGPAGKLDPAMCLAQEAELDAAILDIGLGAEGVWPLADMLQRRGVPFVMASGYSYADVPERFWRVPLVSKPVTRAALEEALRQIGVRAA